MVDVQFSEDPLYDSYIDKQRQIFYKPSSSPVVNNLIESHLFKTEKQAGVTLLVGMAVFMIIIGFLFNKYVLTTSKLDTRAPILPTMIQQ